MMNNWGRVFAGNVTQYFPVSNACEAPGCRYHWQSDSSG
jgi:hypothetical protein